MAKSKFITDIIEKIAKKVEKPAFIVGKEGETVRGAVRPAPSQMPADNLLYRLGITSKPKMTTGYPELGKLENMLLRREPLGDAGRFLNPLISASKGRITAPRALAALGAGIYGGAKALDIFGGGQPTTAETGLTQSQIDYLNLQNQLGEIERAKAQFMPSEDYYQQLQSVADALTAKAMELAKPTGGAATPDISGQVKALGQQTVMGAQAATPTTGTVGALPATAEQAALPSQVSEATKLINKYTQDVNRASNISGAIANLGSSQMKDLATQIQGAAILQRFADQRQAEKDWRNMLIKNPEYMTTLAQSATQYQIPSDKSAQLNLKMVYDEWSKLTPADLDKLATKGIFTPNDLYLELRTNPSLGG